MAELGTHTATPGWVSTRVGAERSLKVVLRKQRKVSNASTVRLKANTAFRRDSIVFMLHWIRVSIIMVGIN